MLELYNSNIPERLDAGGWHIPFSDNMPEVDQTVKLKIATARCARVSYLTFEGKIDIAKDIELHDQLSESGHWSPFEHAAYSEPSCGQVGNFIGWIQYRKKFVDENRKDSRIVVK